MRFGVARPQALVERWGSRALPPPEGTCPVPRCQRAQPSTSTSELRVAARHRALGDCDVEVRRTAGRRARERRDDGVRDRDLDAKVDRRAEVDLEPAAEPECDLAVERTHEGDAARKAAADERGQRAGGETAVLPA